MHENNTAKTEIDDQIVKLRQHAWIHNRAVEIKVKGLALKEQAGMFSGAADLIESQAKRIAELEKRLTITRCNIEAALDGVGAKAIRVREGGGPEDILASLALTFASLERTATPPPGCRPLNLGCTCWFMGKDDVRPDHSPDCALKRRAEVTKNETP